MHYLGIFFGGYLFGRVFMPLVRLVCVYLAVALVLAVIPVAEPLSAVHLLAVVGLWWWWGRRRRFVE